jgi:hypothetical protein
MPGSGLMQLVAHGAQDVYLTGNPQITFFNTVHQRHTKLCVGNNFDDKKPIYKTRKVTRTKNIPKTRKVTKTRYILNSFDKNVIIFLEIKDIVKDYGGAINEMCLLTGEKINNPVMTPCGHLFDKEPLANHLKEIEKNNIGTNEYNEMEIYNTPNRPKVPHHCPYCFYKFTENKFIKANEYVTKEYEAEETFYETEEYETEEEYFAGYEEIKNADKNNKSPVKPDKKDKKLKVQELKALRWKKITNKKK